MRRTWVDHHHSEEDVDLTGGKFHVNMYSWRGIRISADMTYEKNIGGTLPQREWSGLIRTEWRYRQLTFRADGRYRQVRCEEHEYEYFTARLVLRRDF